MLCSSRGGFSSGKEGGKKVKVNKRKCAEESEQVACRAARQALLAGVSVHGLKYQFPLSGSSRLPHPDIAWVSGDSCQQKQRDGP